MTSPLVSATIDIGDVERGLRAMEHRAHQLGTAFKELKAPMRADQREHAAQKTGPESSWSPRKLSTVHAHPKLARKKLLGRLPTAVSYKALPYGVVAESLVKWSLAQQEGGRVGHGASLTARPFLWISGKLLELATDVVSRALLAAYGGR